MDWEAHLNARAKRLVPSVIREMMQRASKPGVISFTAGQPSEDLYPVDALDAALQKVLREEPGLLAYPDSLGDIKLREWIAWWLKAQCVVPEGISERNIVLTTGSQEGINIVSQLFLDEGDAVVVEAPSYPEAMLSFSKEGAGFLTVPFDDDGPDPAALERLLSSRKVSFFYTIPTFQNPTGRSTTSERKRDVLAVLRKHETILIEDDPYRFLWYDQMPELPYSAVAEDGDRIISLGSFSKIVVPGVRCGWMILPEILAPKVAMLRLTFELGLPAFLQRAVFSVVSGPSFAGHLERLRQVYSERRDALSDALSKLAGNKGVSFERPGGGFFIWGHAPEIRSIEFARFAAEEEAVGVIPGSVFFANPGDGETALRFSFANVAPEQAWEGVKRFVRALERYRSGEGRAGTK